MLSSLYSRAGLDKLAYVNVYECHIITEGYACGKNNLNDTALSKLLGGLVRHTVINGRNLKLLKLILLHHLIDEFDSVLKCSCTSYLHHHRNLSELRLVGAIYEVILINVEFLRIEVEVNNESLTLDVKLNKLYSALIEGLIVPAASRLDALEGKNIVLNCGVEVLNILAGLDKSGEEGASESDVNGLTADNRGSFLAVLTHNKNCGLRLFCYRSFLYGCFLCGSFFSRCFLCGSFLSRCFLCRCFFCGSFFCGSFLCGSFLCGSFLSRCFLGCLSCKCLCSFLTVLSEEVYAYCDTACKYSEEEYPEPSKALSLNAYDSVLGEVVGSEYHVIAFASSVHDLESAILVYVDNLELISATYFALAFGNKDLNDELSAINVCGNLLKTLGEEDVIRDNNYCVLLIDLISRLNVSSLLSVKSVVGSKAADCFYNNGTACKLELAYLVTCDNKVYRTELIKRCVIEVRMVNKRNACGNSVCSYKVCTEIVSNTVIEVGNLEILKKVSITVVLIVECSVGKANLKLLILLAVVVNSLAYKLNESSEIGDISLLNSPSEILEGALVRNYAAGDEVVVVGAVSVLYRSDGNGCGVFTCVYTVVGELIFYNLEAIGKNDSSCEGSTGVGRIVPSVACNVSSSKCLGSNRPSVLFGSTNYHDIGTEKLIGVGRGVITGILSNVACGSHLNKSLILTGYVKSDLVIITCVKTLKECALYEVIINPGNSGKVYGMINLFNEYRAYSYVSVRHGGKSNTVLILPTDSVCNLNEIVKLSANGKEAALDSITVCINIVDTVDVLELNAEIKSYGEAIGNEAIGKELVKNEGYCIPIDAEKICDLTENCINMIYGNGMSCLIAKLTGVIRNGAVVVNDVKEGIVHKS